MARLLVIPKPDEGTRAVMVQPEGTDPLDSVFFQGENAITPVHSCGECEAPLIVGMDLEQVQGMVMLCSRCGSYNESTADPSKNQSNS